MLFRESCAGRKACLPVGLLLMVVGLAHQALSRLWIGHFHLGSHVRSVSIDLVSGLALGIGTVLMVNSFSNDTPRSAPSRPRNSEQDGYDEDQD